MGGGILVNGWMGLRMGLYVGRPVGRSVCG